MVCRNRLYMFMRTTFLLCVVCFIPAQAKTLIFDLHKVLIEDSTWAIVDHLGKMKCLRYSGFDSNKLLHRFNEFLTLLEPDELVKVKVECAGKKEPQLKPFPKLFVDCHRGTKSTKEVVDLVKKDIEKNNKFFSSDLEKELISSIIEGMLPENIVNLLSPMDDMIHLLHECYQQVDEKGKRKHTFIILTNWDRDSFPTLYKNKKFKRIFECFDKENIVISSDIKLVKPEPAMYQYVLKKFKLDAKDCVFIDDQELNVDAAKKLGMKVICHSDVAQTRKLLQEYDVIQPRNKKRNNHTEHKTIKNDSDKK